MREAMGLLKRLLKAAEEGGRTGTVIEILVLQALAYGALGNIPPALVLLGRALVLAEPEGYVRIFVDEGEAMRGLLRHAVAKGVKNSYSRLLLSAFDEPAQLVSTKAQATKAQATKAQATSPDLVELLTGREVEILLLIASGMRNQELADHLFISVATVKRHISNAYGKLGVSHRTEAIARASELNLI